MRSATSPDNVAKLPWLHASVLYCVRNAAWGIGLRNAFVLAGPMLLFWALDSKSFGWTMGIGAYWVLFNEPTGPHRGRVWPMTTTLVCDAVMYFPGYLLLASPWAAIPFFGALAFLAGFGGCIEEAYSVAGLMALMAGCIGSLAAGLQAPPPEERLTRAAISAGAVLAGGALAIAGTLVDWPCNWSSFPVVAAAAQYRALAAFVRAPPGDTAAGEAAGTAVATARATLAVIRPPDDLAAAAGVAALAELNVLAEDVYLASRVVALHRRQLEGDSRNIGATRALGAAAATASRALDAVAARITRRGARVVGEPGGGRESGRDSVGGAGPPPPGSPPLSPRHGPSMYLYSTPSASAANLAALLTSAPGVGNGIREAHTEPTAAECAPSAAPTVNYCARALAKLLDEASRAHDRAADVGGTGRVIMPRGRGNYWGRLVATLGTAWDHLRWSSPHLRHGLRLAVATAGTTILYTAVGGGTVAPFGPWAPISTAAVLRPGLGHETRRHLLLRGGGTALGSMLADAWLYFRPGPPIEAALVGIFAFFGFALRPVSPLAFIVAFTQIMLVLASGSLPSDWTAPASVPAALLGGCLRAADSTCINWFRLFWTIVGCGAGILGGLVLFPDWEFARTPAQLGGVITAMQQLLTTALAGYAPTPPPGTDGIAVGAAHRAVESGIAASAAAVERLKSDPTLALRAPHAAPAAAAAVRALRALRESAAALTYHLHDGGFSRTHHLPGLPAIAEAVDSRLGALASAASDRRLPGPEASADIVAQADLVAAQMLMWRADAAGGGTARARKAAVLVADFQLLETQLPSIAGAIDDLAEALRQLLMPPANNIAPLLELDGTQLVARRATTTLNS